ncbi:MAG: hypothetical protein GPOALKHO_001573 [Sodalis sp.]|nr:MAG: hypothetical protein GPOALKHO_001573 [Sodalis sp.]
MAKTDGNHHWAQPERQQLEAVAYTHLDRPLGYIEYHHAVAAGLSLSRSALVAPGLSEPLARGSDRHAILQIRIALDTEPHS